MGSSLFVTAIGFLAQGFFSARILVQWIMSEKAKRVLSPSLFWVFSLLGAYLLCIYGWLRNDFAIVFGQFISYYIYLWNLNANGIWTKIKSLIRVFLFMLPQVATVFLLNDAHEYSESFFNNHDIPIWLVVFGSAGQVMFTLRFVYQFIFSHHRHVSVLPRGFWIISLAGSGMIITYGIIRLDAVLIIGQAFGFVTYIRNLILGSGKTQSSDAE